MSDDSSKVPVSSAPQQSSKPSIWSPTIAILGTLAAFVVSVLAAVLMGGLVQLARDAGLSVPELSQAGQALVFTCVTAIGLISTLWLLLKSRHMTFRDLGFRSWTGDDTSWLFKGALIYFPLLIVALGLASQIPGFDLNETQQTGYESVQGTSLLLAFVGLVVLPPLAEEMVFRGFLYRGLASRWPKVVAALVTSIWFGAVHFQWNVALDTFILSLALIYVLERSKNLWVCVALHALKNFIAFLFIFVLA